MKVYYVYKYLLHITEKDYWDLTYTEHSNKVKVARLVTCLCIIYGTNVSLLS